MIRISKIPKIQKDCEEESWAISAIFHSITNNSLKNSRTIQSRNESIEDSERKKKNARDTAKDGPNMKLQGRLKES